MTTSPWQGGTCYKALSWPGLAITSPGTARDTLRYSTSRQLIMMIQSASWLKTLLKWNGSHRKGSWYIWWWLKLHDQGASPFQAWLITETSLRIQNIFLEDPNQQPLPLCMKFLKLSVLYDNCPQGGKNCANARTAFNKYFKPQHTLFCDDIKTFRLLFLEYQKQCSHVFANTCPTKE